MEEIEHLFEIYWSLYEVYCDNLELAYFLIVNCAEAEEIENWHDFTMSDSRHFKLDTSHVIRHFKLLDPPILVLFCYNSTVLTVNNWKLKVFMNR